VAAPLNGVTVGAATVVALVGTWGWPSVNSETGAMVVMTLTVAVVVREVTIAELKVVDMAAAVVVAGVGVVVAGTGVVDGAAVGVEPEMVSVTPTLAQSCWAKVRAAAKKCD